MHLTLTNREMEAVKMLATGRHFVKDIVIPNRTLERWNNTQHEADLIGMMGEYATAKYLKIPFDTSINLNGDGGETDMYLGEYSIQVKSTKYKNGRLVFNSKEELKADVYILAIVDMDSLWVNIKGIISKNKAKKYLYTEDLGHGTRYCIDQKNLSDICILKTLLI